MRHIAAGRKLSCYEDVNRERKMKIWQDLLSTDYGLMSLIVIAAALIGMVWLAIVAVRKVNGK